MQRRTLIVAAVSLGLVTLVGRNTAVQAFTDVRPDLALAFAPNDPGALIAESRYLTDAPNSPSAAQAALLERAARADPLYPAPFLAEAARDQAKGDDGNARRLAEAARARDPRWTATHAFLLSNYARAGNLPAAIESVGTLANLSSATAPALGKALSSAASDPKTASLLATALASNPQWRGAFIGQATGPAQLLAFKTLTTPPHSVSEIDKTKERSVFIDGLMDAGDYQRAYLAWVNFLPAREAGGVEAIYDGDFKGGAGVEPFSWSLVANEAASAERRTDSPLPGHTALDVNFFGHDLTTIATESLFVGAGSYRFELTGMADGGGQFAGVLRWSLLCLPGRTNIPLAKVSKFDGKPFEVRQSVTIPAQRCSAQQISLVGEPGEVATAIHAQFTRLRLIPR